jgi:SAM-dependent methyltransferase
MNLRLLVKQLAFPGFDVGTRKRMRFVRHFTKGDIETLDAGCGNGAFSFAAVRCGNRVVGIDSDAEKLARCIEFRDHCGIPSDQCSFSVTAISAIPTLKKQYDQIICFETLEHIMDDTAALRALADALKPGGLLHISTPQKERAPYYGEVISTIEDGNHVRLGYTLADFERLFAPLGLRILHHETVVGYFGQRIINILNRADHAFLNRVSPLLRDIAHGSILFSLYPLTFLDPLIGGNDLILFVSARKDA